MVFNFFSFCPLLLVVCFFSSLSFTNRCARQQKGRTISTCLLLLVHTINNVSRGSLDNVSGKSFVKGSMFFSSLRVFPSFLVPSVSEASERRRGVGPSGPVDLVVHGPQGLEQAAVAAPDLLESRGRGGSGGGSGGGGSGGGPGAAARRAAAVARAPALRLEAPLRRRVVALWRGVAGNCFFFFFFFFWGGGGG